MIDASWEDIKMLTGKKVVIFDLDGTLIDSMGIWNCIDEELIESIRTNDVPIQDVGKQRAEAMKQFHQAEDMYLEYCGLLGKKYGSQLPKEEIKKLRYEIADHYLAEKITYKPGAKEVLQYLKEKGFTLIIASTTNDHTIEIYRTRNENIRKVADFDEYFVRVYAKSAVKNLKPNPEIYEKILADFGIQSTECIVIEDSLVGVEAANRAGIEVAVIRDQYSDLERGEINQKSQYQYEDFSEMLSAMKNELG